MNRTVSSISAVAVLAFALLSGCAQSVRADEAANASPTASPAGAGDGSVAVDLSIARYDAPSAVRVYLMPDDVPRSVQLGPQDVLCLRLIRHDAHTVLQIAAQAPQAQPAADLVLAGPGVEPGTYRTTPWQVLARVPTSADSIGGTALSAATFPRCPMAG